MPGGQGLARAADGRAAFVPGGLPGDLVHPVRVQEKKRHLVVHDWELVEAGPDRLVTPPCPLAHRCGGCDWMYLARPAQLRAKADLLMDALRRIGGAELEVAPPEQIGPDLGYRTRLHLHANERGRLGLYEKGSRRVVELRSCPVADDTINGALAHILRLAPRGLPGLRELELRSAPIGAPVVAACVGQPRVTQRWPVRQLAEELPVELDGELFGASPDQAWPLPGGLELRVPVGGFVQVNPEVNRALVQAVLDGALSRQAKSFVDLYCGAGNFALPLLAAGLRGVGIERSQAACETASETAAAAGLDGRFLSGDAAGHLDGLRQEPTPDLLVLDPPRTGARDAVPGIVALAPTTVAYVSCDPPTLARDLGALMAAGYRLVEVLAFDMFPQTHHVEALAWLERVSTPGPGPS